MVEIIEWGLRIFAAFVLLGVFFELFDRVKNFFGGAEEKIPAHLAALSEDERNGLLPAETHFLDHFAVLDGGLEGFFDAVGCYANDSTGEEIENRWYPTPENIEKFARGIRIEFLMPTGLSPADFVNAVEKGGAYIDIPGADISATPVSAARAEITAITRNAFEGKSFGGDFLD